MSYYAIILLIYNCLRDSHLVFNKLKCFRRIMILKVSKKLINSSLSFRLDVYIPYLSVKLDYVTVFHQNLRIAISSHYYDDDDIKMSIFEIPLPVCSPISGVRFVKNGKWKDDIYFLNQEHLKSRPLSSTQRGLNVCQSTLVRFRHGKTLLSDVLPMQK